MALAMLLGFAAAASAHDCAGATPLPADTKITPPGAHVPADLAKFSGAWGGVWTVRAVVGGPCVTVVVEDVFAKGFARVLYSIGTFAPPVPQPRYWRAAGRITDGVLRFELPVPTRAQVTFRVAGAGLAGTFKDGALEAVTTAARIADVSTVACPRRTAPVSPSGTARDRITAAELLARSEPGDGPVHNDYFMPLGAAAPARHTLRGTLTIPASKMSGAWEGCPGLGMPLPSIALEFITHGEHLVPAVRGIVRLAGASRTAQPGIIVSPGRVWSEPGDRGMSRASFPFVLVNAVTNGTHNGLATFVFDDTRVSDLRLQITQETARWERDDYWGQVPLTYVPGAIAHEARLRAGFDAEQRRETPIKPWSALPAAARGPALDVFDGSASRDDISASGLVVDGVLYVKGCHTRAGPYPYCRHMRHGAYSVTKSMGAGIALLRLAAKYGDGVFDLKIADYVRVTATHDGWEHVTFADALNMVVPIGDAGPFRNWIDPQPDESGARLVGWVDEARSAEEKLERGFGYGRYPWTRGEVVRYNSTVIMHTIEPGGRRGVPILGFGLTPTVDDVAKVTTLLQQRGRHDGAQILSAAKIDEALRRTARGLSTLQRSRYGEQRYHLSFWSLPYRSALGCSVDVPYMWGYGGNFVVLLPNGVSAFRFADGNVNDVETMIVAGETIRPICTSPSAAVPLGAAPGPPLTAAELEAELPGNTFGEGGVRVFIAPGGVQYMTVGQRVDVGRWRITPDGLYCRAWTIADSGREHCHHVYRDDNAFTFQVHDRWTTSRWMRTRGADSDL